ncbi:hypothetical protein GVAV_002921 [Gurleya vavrai]
MSYFKIIVCNDNSILFGPVRTCPSYYLKEIYLNSFAINNARIAIYGCSRKIKKKLKFFQLSSQDINLYLNNFLQYDRIYKNLIDKETFLRKFFLSDKKKFLNITNKKDFDFFKYVSYFIIIFKVFKYVDPSILSSFNCCKNVEIKEFKSLLIESFSKAARNFYELDDIFELFDLDDELKIIVDIKILDRFVSRLNVFIERFRINYIKIVIYNASQTNLKGYFNKDFENDSFCIYHGIFQKNHFKNTRKLHFLNLKIPNYVRYNYYNNDMIYDFLNYCLKSNLNKPKNFHHEIYFETDNIIEIFYTLDSIFTNVFRACHKNHLQNKISCLRNYFFRNFICYKFLNDRLKKLELKNDTNSEFIIKFLPVYDYTILNFAKSFKLFREMKKDLFSLKNYQCIKNFALCINYIFEYTHKNMIKGLADRFSFIVFDQPTENNKNILHENQRTEMFFCDYKNKFKLDLMLQLAFYNFIAIKIESIFTFFEISKQDKTNLEFLNDFWSDDKINTEIDHMRSKFEISDIKQSVFDFKEYHDILPPLFLKFFKILENQNDQFKNKYLVSTK